MTMADEGGRDKAGDAGESENGEQRPAARSAAEWTTLGVSFVVVAALVGAALVELFLRDDPPGTRLSVELALERAEVRDGQTYVPFTVRNDGADAATDVVAVFEIKQGEEVVEETAIDIAFLASHGVADGELVTTQDLAIHTVEGRIGAAQQP